MAKKSLLLVDADPRSLRVLEVSLRKAGYSVAACRDGQSALETVDLSPPDLILSDTRLPGMNGFALVEALRKRVENSAIPLMFLSSDSSVESKVRGLELGVEDYLVKPIYIKEIITRINLTLQRQEREGLARRNSISKTRFTGSLADMGLVDLLQTVEISRKSGVLELSNKLQRGAISFRDGQLVDAECGRLRGDSAIYRLLLWNEGEFEIDFRPVRAEQRITSSTQALLMEGMRRIDEWGRLLEQIPGLDNVFEVSEEELVERLAEIPDEINEILRHIDGRRSLMHVVDACDGDDLETLTAITKLYFEGIIYPTGRTAGQPEEDVVEEELVPGGAETAATPDDSDSVPPPSDLEETDASVVPRLPTEPPPADPALVQRAIANAIAATNVPERAAIRVPPPARVAIDHEEAVAGMDAAEPAGSAADQELARAEASPAGHTSDTPEDSPPEVPNREEGMTKKGRRRRKMRSQAAKEAQALTHQAETTNVIQFPAQAKRALSSQVAVNDVGSAIDELDEPAAPPVEARVEKEEPKVEAPAEEKKPEVEAKIEAPEVKPEPKIEPKIEPKMEEANLDDLLEKFEPAKPMPLEFPKAEASLDVAGDLASAAAKAAEAPAFTPPAFLPPVPPPPPSFTKPGAMHEPRPIPEPPPRSKKTSTTSSEIEAVSGSTGEHGKVAQDFFRSAEKVAAPVESETWDDLKTEAVPMAPGMKTAKWATIAILAGGLLLIGGYVAYYNVVMPRPAELNGGSRPADLPEVASGQPEEAPQQAAPEEAPAPEEAAPTEAVAPTEGTPEEAVPAEAVAPVEAAPTEAAPTEAVPAPGSYEELLAQAEAARGARRIPAFEAAIAANPNGHQAHLRLAELLLNTGRPDWPRIAEHAQRGVAGDPSSAMGWLALGAARQETGDTAGARAAYESCIGLAATAVGAARSTVNDCRGMLRTLPR